MVHAVQVNHKSTIISGFFHSVQKNNNLIAYHPSHLAKIEHSQQHKIF